MAIWGTRVLHCVHTEQSRLLFNTASSNRS